MLPKEAGHRAQGGASVAVKEDEDRQLPVVRIRRHVDVIGARKVVLLRPRLPDEILAGRQVGVGLVGSLQRGNRQEEQGGKERESHRVRG